VPFAIHFHRSNSHASSASTIAIHHSVVGAKAVKPHSHILALVGFLGLGIVCLLLDRAKAVAAKPSAFCIAAIEIFSQNLRGRFEPGAAHSFCPTHPTCHHPIVARNNSVASNKQQTTATPAVAVVRSRTAI
jgi:hypothetical protein